MLQKVNVEINQEEAKIRQSAGDMTEEEIRKKARENVLKTFLTMLRVFALDVLLKIFWGVKSLTDLSI